MNNFIIFSIKYQKKNMAPNRFCYTSVEALRLARNRTSRSVNGSRMFAVREGPL